MSDRTLYELLYQFIVEFLEDPEDGYPQHVIENPLDIWSEFCDVSSKLEGRYEEIKHLIISIAKEIDRKEKLKCQYCRIDEGFYVEPPIKAEELCKKHRQEYEEQYEDRTLSQWHPAFIGKEGLHCSSPPRKR